MNEPSEATKARARGAIRKYLDAYNVIDEYIERNASYPVILAALSTEREDAERPLREALEYVLPIIEVIGRTGICSQGGEQTGNQEHVWEAEKIILKALNQTKGGDEPCPPSQEAHQGTSNAASNVQPVAAAKPAVTTFDPTGHDWPEDFSHENGNYYCHCIECGNEFRGHKRRVVCKKCAKHAPPAVTPSADVTTAGRKHLVESAGYWYRAAHNAAREELLYDGVMAMENAYNHVENALAAARDEFKVVERERDEARRERDKIAEGHAWLADKRDEALSQRDQARVELRVMLDERTAARDALSTEREDAERPLRDGNEKLREIAAQLLVQIKASMGMSWPGYPIIVHAEEYLNQIKGGETPVAAAKPHNPDNLTPEQVGVAYGWRLLDEDEVISVPVAEHCCEAWSKGFERWMISNVTGQNKVLTYRTRLTRSELRKAPGLPEEPISNDSGEGKAPRALAGATVIPVGSQALPPVPFSGEPVTKCQPSSERPAVTPSADAPTPESDEMERQLGCRSNTRAALRIACDFARNLERRAIAAEQRLREIAKRLDALTAWVNVHE